jgi:hypothetical protein
MDWFGPALGWMDMSKWCKLFLVVDEMNGQDWFV